MLEFLPTYVREGLEAARKKDLGNLASMVAEAANDEDKSSDWLDMLVEQAGSLKSSEKKV
mgnify:CR=1 FL=1